MQNKIQQARQGFVAGADQFSLLLTCCNYIDRYGVDSFHDCIHRIEVLINLESEDISAFSEKHEKHE